MPTNHEPCGKEDTTLIPKLAGPMAELRRRALLDHRACTLGRKWF